MRRESMRWVIALAALSMGAQACGSDEKSDTRTWSIQEVDRSAPFTTTTWSDESFEATDMRFLPDGRALLLTKGGWEGPGVGNVELLDADGSFLRTVLELPVCADAERGLLGIEVDPSFATTSQIFLFYTRQMSGCATVPEDQLTWGTDPPAPVYNRVSSFVFDEDGIDVSTEHVLLDDLPAHQSAHNGGGMALLADGTLLVGVGEAVYGLSDDVDVPMGKVLRIDPANPSVPPPDNPFASGDPSGAAPLVFASGLRNPFRIAVDPVTQVVVAGDVGTDEFEELDIVRAGKSYGFPDVEGPNSADGSVEPALWYRHVATATCNSIIGGSFLPVGFVDGSSDRWFAFSDLGCGGVWAAKIVGDEVQELVRLAPQLDHSLSNLVVGPDSSLYLVGIGPAAQPVSRLSPLPVG